MGQRQKASGETSIWLVVVQTARPQLALLGFGALERLLVAQSSRWSYCSEGGASISFDQVFCPIGGQLIAVIFAVFGVIGLVFMVLSFRQAILCSKVIALLQGTDLENELRSRTAPKLRWYGIRSPTGYDAMSSELWREILKMPNPPEAVAGIIGEMRSVWRNQMIALSIGATAMAAWVAIYIAGYLRCS